MGNPLPREEHRPTILEMSVLNVRYSFSTTPRKIVFISGIPEPVIRIHKSFYMMKNTKSMDGLIQYETETLRAVREWFARVETKF